MRFVEEFRDRAAVESIARRIEKLSPEKAVIMEVCGTHTMSAARFRLRALLPEGVRLVSGPGCPVCVTDQRDIDAFIELGGFPGVVLATFGDMMRVPGSKTSLEKLRAAGADVRVVYSPLDALDTARREPDRTVIFFGAGFETTVPATALAIAAAAENGVKNFCVFCVHKTMPPALRALLSGGEVRVSGMLLPGHVSTIIGLRPYDFIAKEFGVPCAAAGFEPVDIMLGVESIVRQMSEGRAGVENAYARAVAQNPNPYAAALIERFFVPADACWRGLGTIPDSGLVIRDEYESFDARRRFDIDSLPAVSACEAVTACRCGDVLRGAAEPRACGLFGSACTPSAPRGPCMVSSEGACAAEFRYGGVSL